MEQPRLEMVELRAGLSHLAGEVADLRQEVRTDIRRLDDRIVQLLLLQLGTIAATLASIAVTVLR